MWKVHDNSTYSSWQDDRLMVKKLIENIPTPLVSFAGSGVAGFFMGMFLRRMLKLGAVFLVFQWMHAHQYIGGQLIISFREMFKFLNIDRKKV